MRQGDERRAAQRTALLRLRVSPDAAGQQVEVDR